MALSRTQRMATGLICIGAVIGALGVVMVSASFMAMDAEDYVPAWWYLAPLMLGAGSIITGVWVLRAKR